MIICEIVVGILVTNCGFKVSDAFNFSVVFACTTLSTNFIKVLLGSRIDVFFFFCEKKHQNIKTTFLIVVLTS